MTHVTVGIPYRQENDTLWLVKCREPLHIEFSGSLSFVISQLNARFDRTVPDFHHTIKIKTELNFDNEATFELQYIRPATPEEIDLHVHAEQFALRRAAENFEAQQRRDLSELQRLRALYPDA